MDGLGSSDVSSGGRADCYPEMAGHLRNEPFCHEVRIIIYMADLEKWQTGDEAAFEVMVRQHERLVFGAAYLMTGSKEEAEDVLQEVFASLWQARGKFDPGRAKLGTWLYRVTVNRCVDKHRKKRPAPLSLETAALESRSPGREELPEGAVEMKLRREELVGAIGTLDSKHRAVVVLRYFNERSYGEIAKKVRSRR